MKYFFTKYRFFLSGAALILTAASCTSTLSDEPATDARAISFTPAAETRAAVETDFPDDSSFSVWGWYGTDSQITNNVFDGETVTKSGNNWSYDGGTRYWIPGMTYNFYGVYPANIATYNEQDQTLNVTNFQCPTSIAGMTNVTDLMTAYRKGMSGSNPETVTLIFKHALTRINLAVKLADDMPANYKVDINFINLTAYTQGSMSYLFTEETPTPAWNAQQNPQVFDFNGELLQNNTNITATGSANSSVDVTTQDLYLIPQTMEENILSIKINYRLKNDKTEGEAGYHYIDNEIEIPLYNASIQTWNPGESLTYTITISRYNVTVILNVGDWEDGNNGNTDIKFQ